MCTCKIFEIVWSCFSFLFNPIDQFIFDFFFKLKHENNWLRTVSFIPNARAHTRIHIFIYILISKLIGTLIMAVLHYVSVAMAMATSACAFACYMRMSVGYIYVCVLCVWFVCVLVCSWFWSDWHECKWLHLLYTEIATECTRKIMTSQKHTLHRCT